MKKKGKKLKIACRILAVRLMGISSIVAAISNVSCLWVACVSYTTITSCLHLHRQIVAINTALPPSPPSTWPSDSFPSCRQRSLTASGPEELRPCRSTRYVTLFRSDIKLISPRPRCPIKFLRRLTSSASLRSLCNLLSSLICLFYKILEFIMDAIDADSCPWRYFPSRPLLSGWRRKSVRVGGVGGARGERQGGGGRGHADTTPKTLLSTEQLEFELLT